MPIDFQQLVHDIALARDLYRRADRLLEDAAAALASEAAFLAAAEIELSREAPEQPPPALPNNLAEDAALIRDHGVGRVSKSEKASAYRAVYSPETLTSAERTTLARCAARLRHFR